MGSRTLTITLNSNHTKKAAIVLPPDSADAQLRILREARNKFRSKALSHVYLPGGTELDPTDVLPPGIAQVWVGKGEPYAGPSISNIKPEIAPGVVRVLAREAHVDDTAIAQLTHVASLPGVRHAVGMPDLHPGGRFPIGCAIASEGVYPALVGSDIGCGVALYYIASQRKLTPARLAARLVGLDTAWDGDRREWLRRYNIDDKSVPDEDLGTVGAGNHFAELCDVEAVLQPVAAHQELVEGALCLLVHSGSRGLGAAILAEQIAGGNANPVLLPNTPELTSYLSKHDAAVQWARANRDLIAHRIRTCLFSDADQQPAETLLKKITDVTHNSVKQCTIDGTDLWVHRKGAAPSQHESGLVPCPGSRGTFSYLLSPIGSGEPNCTSFIFPFPTSSFPKYSIVYSLAHGAGRRHPRSKMHEGSPAPPSTTTALGSEVVCNDRALMLEERPEAYKDVEAVVRDMEGLGMARPIVKLRPIVSYKVREGTGNGR
jgi:release factor H-coupled RctB family protein